MRKKPGELLGKQVLARALVLSHENQAASVNHVSLNFTVSEQTF
jgi:hypothetical protein